MESWQKLARVCEQGLTFVFLQCGKKKLEGVHRAKDIYRGTYFQFSLRLARQLTSDDRIFVLSAKYGVLRLSDRIRSYNRKLTQLSKAQRQRWQRKARRFIRKHCQKGRKVFLTGRLYHQGFDGIKPMPNVGIGYQLQFMKRLLSKREGFDS